jgi:hypothetical protein
MKTVKVGKCSYFENDWMMQMRKRLNGEKKERENGHEKHQNGSDCPEDTTHWWSHSWGASIYLERDRRLILVFRSESIFLVVQEQWLLIDLNIAMQVNGASTTEKQLTSGPFGS